MPTPRTPAGKDRLNQVELCAHALIEIGRRLNTSSPERLAAAYYAEHGIVPQLAALDLAELVLRGEEVRDQ